MAETLSVAHRLWRALPATGRRAGLTAVATALAPRADRRPPAQSAGIVVAGELAASTGVGEAARTYAAGCAAAGALRGEIPLGIGARPASRPPADAAVLLSVNAPSVPLMLARAQKDFLRGRRVIGAWAWELPVVPASWAAGGRYVHEVWACSPFTADALERVMPGRVRIVPYPVGMRAAPAAIRDRAAFGLPEAAVVTLMIFSLGSSFTRKNPLAGIAAFKAAFGDRPDQILFVKYAGAAAYPREAALIEAQAAPNVLLHGGYWPQARVAGLTACADIVLSLHRSEGFGLVPAQAMLAGIPVIATGWSGNMAFMDEQSAALVGYRLVPVEDATGVYAPMPGAVWAEPDVGHAAEHLRRLGDDAAARRALGARGQVRAAAALNGDSLRAALAENGIAAAAATGQAADAANGQAADAANGPAADAANGPAAAALTGIDGG